MSWYIALMLFCWLLTCIWRQGIWSDVVIWLYQLSYKVSTLWDSGSCEWKEVNISALFATFKQYLICWMPPICKIKSLHKFKLRKLYRSNILQFFKHWNNFLRKLYDNNYSRMVIWGNILIHLWFRYSSSILICFDIGSDDVFFSRMRMMRWRVRKRRRKKRRRRRKPVVQRKSKDCQELSHQMC